MDLVERESDLGALADLLDGLVDGRSRAALIEGPAGIGKSRLLGALRDGADARGVRALAARGRELEREFPFGVVRQLFEPALAGADREAAFAGAGAPARAVFAGEVDEGATFAVLHGLYWLTLHVRAARPAPCTGATPPRCASSPTWCRGWRARRSSSERRCAPPRPPPTRCCSAR